MKLPLTAAVFAVSLTAAAFALCGARAQASAQRPIVLASGLDATRATIPISINGLAYNCVLDTGTSVMLVSNAVARNAGLRYGDAIDELAPDGRRYADHHTMLARLEAGGFALNAMPALISSKLRGDQVLCGYDFFAQIPTIIDRDRRLVTLFPETTAFDSLKCLPVDLTPRVPVTTIQLNGTPLRDVVLDSGMVGGGAFWSGAVGRGNPALEEGGMACGRAITVAFVPGQQPWPTQLCSSSQRPDGYNGIMETNLPNVHVLGIDYPNRRVCF